jgi:hypothetical protein
MRFITLITVAISALAFVSQSASALPVQDSHRESSELSKRQLGCVPVGSNADLSGLLGVVLDNNIVPAAGKGPTGALGLLGGDTAASPLLLLLLLLLIIIRINKVLIVVPSVTQTLILINLFVKKYPLDIT